MKFRKVLMSKLKRKHSIDQPTPPIPNIFSTLPADNFLVQRHPQDPGPAIPYTTTFTSTSTHQNSLCLATSDTSTAGSVSPEKVDIDLTQSLPIPMSSDGHDLDADWKYALELQAQLDAEEVTSPASPTPSLNSSSKKQKVDSMRDSIDFPISIFDNDEEYAMALKAELDFEATYASQPLMIDVSLSQSIPENLQDVQMAQDLQAQFDREETQLMSRKTNSDVNSVVDQRASTQLLYAFGQSVLKLRCCKCSKALVYNEKEILKLTKEWSHHKRYTSAVSCPKCTYSRTSTCAGCGKSPNTMITAMITGAETVWCCDRGRLFIIWALLSSPTLTQPVVKNRPITRSHSTSASSARKNNSQLPGIGYGDSGSRRRGAKDVAIQISEKDSTDDEVTTTLSILSSLLPSWEKSSPFDHNPPEELIHMIRRSVVLERVSELLRNDSIDNVTKRKKLYKSVMKFVKSLTEHHTTACIIFEERISYPPSQSLLAVSFGDAINRTFIDRDIEKLQSLARIMKPLQLQAQTFYKQVCNVQDLSNNGTMDFTEANHEAVQLCKEILDLSSFLHANAIYPATTTGREEDAKKEKDEDLTEWHRDNCVDDIPDSELLSAHHYSSSATQLANPAKGRMKRLLMEIASLRTSLPPGVYVRHGSSRLDVMKAVIVGPKDTPYENGLFEFDIWCPGNYPQEPPKVQFKTTGGGKAHFNPNLYPEGKVCLSLIGTWSGEPWRPGQSTLLQVLVSIQSMVFCDEPWCNEPGRENQAGSDQSKSYNRTIRRLTVQYAMLDWVKHIQPVSINNSIPNGTAASSTASVGSSQNLSQGGNGIWTFLAEKHFKAHSRQIIKNVSQWANDGLGSSVFNPFGPIGDAITMFGPNITQGTNGVPSAPSYVPSSDSDDDEGDYIPVKTKAGTFEESLGGPSQKLLSAPAIVGPQFYSDQQSTQPPHIHHTLPPYSPKNTHPAVVDQSQYGISSYLGYGASPDGHVGLMALATASQMQGQAQNTLTNSTQQSHHKMKNKLSDMFSGSSQKKQAKKVAPSPANVPLHPPPLTHAHTYPSQQPYAYSYYSAGETSFIPSVYAQQSHYAGYCPQYIAQGPSANQQTGSLLIGGAPNTLTKAASSAVLNGPVKHSTGYMPYAPVVSSCIPPQGLSMATANQLASGKPMPPKALYEPMFQAQKQAAAAGAVAPINNSPSIQNTGKASNAPKVKMLDNITRDLLSHLAYLIVEEHDEMRILALRLTGVDKGDKDHGKKRAR